MWWRTIFGERDHGDQDESFPELTHEERGAPEGDSMETGEAPSIPVQFQRGHEVAACRQQGRDGSDVIPRLLVRDIMYPCFSGRGGGRIDGIQLII